MALALIAAGAAGSCSSSPQGGRGSNFDSGGGTAGATGSDDGTGSTGVVVGGSLGGGVTGSTGPMIATIDGLSAVNITADQTNVTMTGGQAATVKLTAMGMFSDGRDPQNVTSALTWTTDAPSSVVTISGGNVTIKQPGIYVIVANANNQPYASISITVTSDGGSVVPPEVPAAAAMALDAGPAGTCSRAPSVAYPYNLAMFPYTMPAEFQIVGPNSGFVRFEVTGSVLSAPFTTYAACNPIPGLAGACAATVPQGAVPTLAGISTGDQVKVGVRFVSADGSCVADAAQMEVRWSFVPVSGGLYYWRTIPWKSLNLCGPSDRTGIYRFDLDMPGQPPQPVLANLDDVLDHTGTACIDNDPTHCPQPPSCIGCHSLTWDGTRMMITFGGSDTAKCGTKNACGADDLADCGSRLALFDLMSGTKLADTTPTPAGNLTVFSKDGSMMVNEFNGQLTLHQVAPGFPSIGPVFADVGESATHPYWSPSGNLFAFTGFVPGVDGNGVVNHNGDIVVGGEVWLGQSDGVGNFSNPKVIAPREPGVSKYYPAITKDDKWVFFNESSCSGPKSAGMYYGQLSCDGYDDPSAQIRLVSVNGGSVLPLNNVNGTGTVANSWPRVSPTLGTFRGMPLYWVAFSSRRPYGAKIPGSMDGTSLPQLWIAAVIPDLANGNMQIDPSFAPVWIPDQDDKAADGTLAPTGNHVPQWVLKAVPIPPPPKIMVK